MRRRITLLAGAAFLAACGSSSPYSTGTNNDPSPTTANTINANPALDFKPTTLTVPAGTTVTFSFGSVAHTVTFNNAGSPANVPASSNTQVGVAFPTAGTYPFHCSIHPTMTGSITVH